jgi:hypothetical protein
VVGGGHAGLVAEPLKDVESALVLACCLSVIAALSGEVAKLTVGVGHAGLVAEPLGDVEGVLTVACGGDVIPPRVGNSAADRSSLTR